MYSLNSTFSSYFIKFALQININYALNSYYKKDFFFLQLKYKLFSNLNMNKKEMFLYSLLDGARCTLYWTGLDFLQCNVCLSLFLGGLSIKHKLIYFWFLTHVPILIDFVEHLPL